MIHQKLLKNALRVGSILAVGFVLLSIGSQAHADWPIRSWKLQELNVRKEVTGTWKFKSWSSRKFITRIEKAEDERWELQVCRVDQIDNSGGCERGDWDRFNGSYTYEPSLSGLCKREPLVTPSVLEDRGCSVLLTAHRFLEVDQEGKVITEGPVQLVYNLDPHGQALPGTGPHTGSLERTVR